MRLDLPQEILDRIPRRRAPEAELPVPPLEPSPFELHRDDLQRQREHPRQVSFPAKRQRDLTEAPRRQPDIRRDRAHDLPDARRARRNELPQQAVGLSLRAEEVKALGEIARFRVLATRDLAATVYQGQSSQLARDLRFLSERGLVRVDSVNARRDGHYGKVERLEVATLTRAGCDLTGRVANLPVDQKLYSGLVKPREVEHDAQIYRAYIKEAERIERDGGSNLRVRLDFELKSQIQKAIYAQRKANPGRDIAEIKRSVASEHNLPFVNNSIQIPDARIEYDLPRKEGQEMDRGGQSGHADVEVLTAAYHPGHLRGKAQAGFRLYASSADRASLTARVEDEHHLLDNILEL
jgi:hypothetical protein